MENILLLILCFLLGQGARHIKSFPESTPTVLNQFIIYISVPAIALLQLHNLTLEFQLIYALAMAWIVFLIGCLFFSILGQWLNWSRATIGGLSLVACLGNTSFVGFPMVEAFYGKEGLAIAMVNDLPGSFLTLSTLGILVAAFYSKNVSDENRNILKSILSFPPFIALILAIALKPFHYPEWGISILSQLGNTLAPLALFSVGYQVQWQSQKELLVPLFWGLSYKLLLAPLMIFGLYLYVFELQGLLASISIFEAAMGPMITASIIANEYKLNPQLINMLLAVGIPLSLLTVPLWWLILNSMTP